MADIVNLLGEGLDNRENKHISTDNMLKMAEFVLKNNYFEFKLKLKEQLLGTGIGTKFAPTYTSIYGNLESDFLKSQELTPWFWYCYSDDIFFIWTHGEKKTCIIFKIFLITTNLILSLSIILIKKKKLFLYLNMKLSENNLSTDVHIKSTDRHQYLHYTSSHTGHTKKFVVYSQALILSRICLLEKDFDKHINEMK